MKKFIYTFAIMTSLISSTLFTFCTADEVVNDSKNQIIVNVNQIDPPVVADRPK